jgi:hypothetical protein
MNNTNDPHEVFRTFALISAIASAENSLINLRIPPIANGSQASDAMMEAVMEGQLWPEIRAMLVAELDQISHRFPSFSRST